MEEVKFKKSKIEIALYVAAVIMAAIGCFMVYGSVAYITSYASMYGMTFADMFSDAMQYVFTQCFAYFGFAIVTAGIGAVYGQIAPQMVFEVAENAEEAEEVVEVAEEEAQEEATEELAETLEENEVAVCDECEDCAECEAEDSKEDK